MPSRRHQPRRQAGLFTRSHSELLAAPRGGGADVPLVSGWLGVLLAVEAAAVVSALAVILLPFGLETPAGVAIAALFVGVPVGLVVWALLAGSTILQDSFRDVRERAREVEQRDVVPVIDSLRSDPGRAGDLAVNVIAVVLGVLLVLGMIAFSLGR